MKFDWSKTNAELAARHGIDRSKIARTRRAETGRPAPGRKCDMSGWREELTDAENARLLRISVHTVIRHRQKLGLPPRRDPAPPIDWRNVDWSQADTAIAEQKKCHVLSVWKARRRLDKAREKEPTMKMDSMKMAPANWRSLTRVALDTNSIYCGAPSWRRLMLRIARGEVRCTEAPKSKRCPKE